MREFKIDKCPYDTGLQVYDNSKIEIKEGVTVLVGCNGSGKSTLLRTVKEQLKEAGIPVMEYDNYSMGGSYSMQKLLDEGKLDILAEMAISSEGEKIYINMNDFAGKLKGWFERNKDKEEYWLLFDAIGSGLSIDYIIELKNLFELICFDMARKKKKMYIVVSTNEYEFCIRNNGFDVQKGKYIEITDYASYREIIQKSREKKNKYYEKYLDKKYHRGRDRNVHQTIKEL